MEPNEKVESLIAKSTLYPEPEQPITDPHELLFNKKNNIPQRKSVSIFEALEKRRLEDIAEVKKQIESTSQHLQTYAETPSATNAEDLHIASEEIAFQAKVKQQKNFRLKLVTVVFAIIAGLCAIWITYSSITLDKTNYLIAQHTAQTEILNQENNHLEENEQVIPNQVTLDKNPIAISEDAPAPTNFFDKLCNFFSGLFGG